MFTLASCLFSTGNVFQNGFIIDSYDQGSLLYLLMLLTVSLKLFFYTNFVTRALIVSELCSILAWILVFSSQTSSLQLFTSIYVWAALFLTPIAGNLRDFLWKFYRRIFKPRPYHIVQEMDSLDRKQRSKQTKFSSPSEIPLIIR